MGRPLPRWDADLSPDDDHGLARLVRDDGVPANWERRTAPRRIRRWDSGVRIRSVRFGGGRAPSRDEREEGREPVRGGGGRRRRDALVEGRRPGRRSAQPGGRPAGRFALSRGGRAGRRVSAAGQSPFAARGEVVRDLMQGQLLRPASVDALRSTVVEGLGRARADGGVGQPDGAAGRPALRWRRRAPRERPRVGSTGGRWGSCSTCWTLRRPCPERRSPGRTARAKLALVDTAPLVGQTAEDDLIEEIIVTANKRSQSVQDVAGSLKRARGGRPRCARHQGHVRHPDRGPEPCTSGRSSAAGKS